MSESLTLKIIGALAVIQGLGGALRAFYWFDVGSDLLGQGLLLLPLVGVLAFARGAIVIVLALLCLLFAYGVFTRRSWSRPLGIIISIANLLLVINLMLQGDSAVAALPWAVIPVAVLVYLFSSAGRTALGRTAAMNG
jgi:hypothetical protein